MEKNTLNYLVDLVMAIVFFLVLATGLIKYPGLLDFFGVDRFSLPLGLITQVHDTAGPVLIVLVLLHLALHFSWIVSTTLGFFKR